MRGHIAKKGNRYYVVIHEGPDPATGKPRYRWHAAGGSRGEAEKLLAEIVKRVHDGDYRSPDKITVSDYLLNRWLPSKRTRVKPSTANSYERNIRLHINPNIGAIPLQRLQPEDLDELYVKLLTEGKRNGAGGGLSAKSVRNIHATLQSALSDAARKGTVVRNVADTADPPSISRSGRSISVWTGDQLRRFLDAMADHELYPLYLLAATTGMRRGELAGLPWSNVDLDAARLTVNQQIVSVQYKLIEGDLKTPTSRRSIDLDPRTVAELRRHRRRQLEERMATGQARRRRLRVRQARRLAHPPRPDQPDLRARRRQARRPPHPPTRPAPHPRHHPAAAERAPQGRQRTPRPLQRRLHHDRLPTRHARPASPGSLCVRNRSLRQRSRVKQQHTRTAAPLLPGGSSPSDRPFGAIVPQHGQTRAERSQHGEGTSTCNSRAPGGEAVGSSLFRQHTDSHRTRYGRGSPS